jgi:hypothetical protein
MTGKSKLIIIIMNSPWTEIITIAITSFCEKPASQLIFFVII